MAKSILLGERTAAALKQLLKGQLPGVTDSRFIPASAAIDGNRSSPDTVGSNSEGSTTASTSTWSQGTTPVDVWVVGRVVYDHAGDETLYAMARKLQFDGLGRLYAVSAETKITVDAPDDC